MSPNVFLSLNDYNARKRVMKILINGLFRSSMHHKTSNKRCLTLFIFFPLHILKLVCVPKLFSKLSDKSILMTNVLT